MSANRAPRLKKHYHTLRLILGDQLSTEHSWYQSRDDDTLYVIAELQQELSYTRHHIQKITAFFNAMQCFGRELQAQGHHLLHLDLDDTSSDNNLSALLSRLLRQYQCQRFEYQQPDEARLAKQLQNFCQSETVSCQCVDSEHFLLPYAEIHNYFKANAHNRMESFYRKMRKRFNILMEAGQPLGGKWNYDSDNRHALKAKDLADIPAPLLFTHSNKAFIDRLERHNIETIGDSSDVNIWPSSRQESVALLDYFCQHCLPRFGRFQDAMTAHSEHSWSLYHSRLSFSLNAKMLKPAEVVAKALTSYENSLSNTQEEGISLAQVEGFIRQIIGWREYVRGMYWVNQPGYQQLNALTAKRSLPSWYWDGQTNMHCMQKAIGQSLQYAYAHHIQRLMLTGNFALLAGIDPDHVEQWYLGIYIDAIEWVEQPNTRGMALFADNGWIATKPYAASANYINKMTDYCKSCHYQPKHKTEVDACPFNSLYWHFLHRNRAELGRNPRLAFPYKSWDKMRPKNQQQLLNKADELLASIDSL